MADIPSFARWIIIAGLVLIIVGVLIVVASRAGIPLGRLPGDILFQGENASCFIPIASMLVLSLLLTIILNILIRIFNR
jgi:hypothetical protein